MLMHETTCMIPIFYYTDLDDNSYNDVDHFNDEMPIVNSIDLDRISKFENLDRMMLSPRLCFFIVLLKT